MRELPPLHLCIVQPAGHVHALGLIDQARYFRYQLRRLGATVTTAKNRLRSDAVNFVFGAHLGFDTSQLPRHSCIFVNNEPLGTGASTVSHEYLKLLAHCAVVDGDRANLPAYAAPSDVPLAPLLHAPYLAQSAPIPLEQRPVDLLFIGTINARRQAWIDRVEACGVKVSIFAGPVYGAERDLCIRHAKAVLNVHAEEGGRFEADRVAHCLSLGTPVVSERGPATAPHEAFEDSVVWLEDARQLEQFFRDDFATPAYFDIVRAGLARFEAADPIEDYADLLAFTVGFERADRLRRDAGPWRPTLMHFGAGGEYLPGWLNVDSNRTAQPDLVLDVCKPLDLPMTVDSASCGQVLLQERCLDVIQLSAATTAMPGLPVAIDNAMRLLKPDGELRVDVPCMMEPVTPAEVMDARNAGESALAGYTRAFWQLGWYEHRLEVVGSSLIDLRLEPTDGPGAAYARITLRKVETSPRERTLARTMQVDLCLPLDDVAPERMYGAVAGAPAVPARSGFDAGVALPIA
jgi:hypothetical protein